MPDRPISPCIAATTAVLPHALVTRVFVRGRSSSERIAVKLRAAVLGVVFAFSAASAGLVAGPAHANASVKPTVSISVSDASVFAGRSVTLRGKVSDKAKGAMVQLQKKTGSHWVDVKRDRLGANKTYSFKVSPPKGVHSYRAKVLKNHNLKSATSRAVRIEVRGHVVQPPANLEQVRVLIFAQVNEERIARGLPLLTYSTAMNPTSQNWAMHMAETREMVHNPDYYNQMPQGWSQAAENIAMGYGPSNVMEAWMNSPGHAGNILDDHTHMSVGYAVASDGTPFYVQNFGKY
ncbi:MAG: CAP domain-containing protein [Nocardioides sp.]